MGRCRKNRLSLRRLRLLALITAAVSGALIPPTVLSGGPTTMVVTFLGLVSASILPSVSLVIGSMSASGRSVLKIDELATELAHAIRLLFSTLGLVAVVVVLLLILSFLPNVSWHVPLFVSAEVPDLARRCLQALAAMITVIAVIRALNIPKILYRVLEIKKEIAVFEARKNLRDNAPSETQIRDMFPRKEGFGKTVSLEEARR